MQKFQVVGLSGKAGTGKDYIAQNILAPLGFKQFSFAFHFKVWLVGKQEATYEEVFHTKPEHVRKLMQEEGTERGRLIYGEDIWADTMMTWLRLLNETMGLDKFVIPDVRFPNEVSALQKAGGKVFRIVAPKRAEASPLTEIQRQHVSEVALDNLPFNFFNGYIYNDPEHANTVKMQVRNLLRAEFPLDVPDYDTTGEFPIISSVTNKIKGLFS